jgi:glutathione-regulated potassium-efflux system ancillary protein KefC
MALHEAGAHDVEREVFESSLRSARAALEAIGHDRFEARQVADRFRRYSTSFLRSAVGARHSESDMIVRVRQSREQFEREMQEEIQQRGHRTSDHGWQRGDAPNAGDPG